MALTNLKYDSCSYKEDLKEEVSYLNYLLDINKFYRCSPCRPELGIVGGTNVSNINGNLVDLESNLFGIDRRNSKCSAKKYIPPCENENKIKFKNGEGEPIDTSKLHLNTCQLFPVHKIPHPEKLNLYNCENTN